LWNELIIENWQSGRLTEPAVYCPILKKAIRKIIDPGKPSRRRVLGHKPECFIWLMSAGLHLPLMLLRVSPKTTIPPVPLLVPRVRLWPPLTFPLMLSPLLFMQLPRFVTLPVSPMLVLPRSRNVIGNISICLKLIEN
jgi:hypothetical protein